MPVPRFTPSLLRSPRARCFSTSISRRSYEDTVQNLKIGKHTRVLYQGFTGKVATQNAKESLEYGTNIVGGVKPGGSGEHLGLPAKEQLKPDATAIYVAAPHAGKAIEEAIEAEIPLIVAVAEHIPLHDILRIMSILKTQSKSRVVGANAPGIISAIGHCRIGFQPLPTFSPGHVGIVAKSGTLSYETVASITRAGLGQSLCIGMGGDVVAGTNFVDALRVFETDPDTEAIVLVGEIGGSAELEAADWIKDYYRREKNPKMAPAGRVMGHAGAWAGVGEATAEEKYKILQDAGVTMVDHPEKFGNVMKGLLKQAGKDVSKIQQSAVANQRRGLHTMRRVRPRVTSQASNFGTNQQRTLHLRNQKAVDHLSKSLKGFNITEETPNNADSVYLSISVDRSSRSPCIITSPSANPRKLHHRLRRFPFSYLEGPDQETILAAIQHLQLDAAPPAAHAQTAKLISKLADLYREQEAVSQAVNLSISPSGTLNLSQPQLFYDDAAFRSNKRHPDLHSLRDTSLEPSVEVEAEKSGIVFVKLHPDDDTANIGTLVNGAGGKATSETVKTSFELILRDPRVKVIFVNIFGGLTDCGMIADGVIMAFEKVDMKGIPVVVRLRGTNEEVGQKKIAESGLPLEAFDGFHEAAQRVVELASRS
ncbi:unnamed protein product [Aureobasidium mustum]|uniref:CoA-binding domain-containing protein n=1 Tax=Aureobasidium mustum TaxID=2773714 RepID=A0A9N8PKS8_9PEZI|nr:unnamed protein product [Aureobasidium mustum]